MSPNQRMKPVSLYFLDKIDILVDVYMISIILHINSKPYQNRMTIPQEILRHSPKKLNNFQKFVKTLLEKCKTGHHLI